MKKTLDFLLSLLLFILLVIPMCGIIIAIRLTSKGSALYWPDRVGKNNKIFKMPKFRSMLIDTPTVVTHLLDNPDTYLFPIGGFLRRSSLNELSQLFSVLKGDMSLVDPRLLLVEYLPLYSEKQARRHEIKPGITGGAD